MFDKLVQCALPGTMLSDSGLAEWDTVSPRKLTSLVLCETQMVFVVYGFFPNILHIKNIVSPQAIKKQTTQFTNPWPSD